jgi:hypothetical protein
MTASSNVVALTRATTRPSPTSHGREWREALVAAKKRWVFQSPEDQLRMADNLTYWDDWRVVRALPRVPVEGCTVIVVGEKQVHKTGILLHDCLLALQKKQATVLYLAAEGGHGIKTRRLPTYCVENGLDIADLTGSWVTFSNSPNLLNDEDVDTFIAVCEEEGFRPDIVVIDTLTRASGDEDICTPQTGASIIMSMERMARSFGGATVIGVTHPPKHDSKGRAIGSAQLENLAYAVLRVAKKDGLVNLTVAAMKDGPAGPDQVISFKVQGGGEEEAPPVVVELGGGVVPATKAETPMDKVVAALVTFGPEGARAVEWQRRCEEREGPKSGSFYTQKDKAIAAGLVSQVGDRFVVTPPATSTPE